MFDVFPEKAKKKTDGNRKIRQKPDCKTIFDAKSFYSIIPVFQPIWQIT